jgi:hypothetical protein
MSKASAGWIDGGNWDTKNPLAAATVRRRALLWIRGDSSKLPLDRAYICIYN